MTFFKQKTRSRFDLNTEFAAKRLPVHPITRYSSFSSKWKQTRKIGGYVPWPKNNQDDLFPCCRTCQTVDRPASDNEAIWRKTANAAWLRAEWKWDFGHLLPAGLIAYGLGVTPPVVQPERDRVFLLNPDFSRGYLDLDLEKHAKAGADQHEAKVRVSGYPTFELVVFEGQVLISPSGYIAVAIPRETWWTSGREVWQRFTFKTLDMSYDLSNSVVLHDDSIKVVDGKILFKGKQI